MPLVGFGILGGGVAKRVVRIGVVHRLAPPFDKHFYDIGRIYPGSLQVETFYWDGLIY